MFSEKKSIMPTTFCYSFYFSLDIILDKRLSILQKKGLYLILYLNIKEIWDLVVSVARRVSSYFHSSFRLVMLGNVK